MIAQLALLLAALLGQPEVTAAQRTCDVTSYGAGGTRIFELLDAEPEITERADARPMPPGDGHIRLEGVSFAFTADGPRALSDIDLDVPAGTTVALIGPTGSGKTTLTQLIPRFYEATAGRVLIDGADVRELRLGPLRAAVGMVSQDPFLFSTTVRENIAYGRPDATEEEIIAAAKLAEAHDFIATLQDPKGNTGYDAHVGERGVKLSGGQRQRIAIARVLLKNAPILVLDEATSALDSEVELAIQAQLIDLMEGKTVIAIAHRLSTIARMDRLVVLEAGRIVETGTHDELLALGGHYEKLWRHQSGGFLADDVPDGHLVEDPA